MPIIWNPGNSGGGGSGVTTFNTRSGAVVLLSSDVTGALGYTPANAATYVPYTGATQTLDMGSESIGAAFGGFGGIQVTGGIVISDAAFLEYENLADPTLDWRLTGQTTGGFMLTQENANGDPTMTFFLHLDHTTGELFLGMDGAGGYDRRILTTADLPGGGVTTFNTRSGAVVLLNSDVTGATGNDLSSAGHPVFDSLQVTGVDGIDVVDPNADYKIDGNPVIGSDSNNVYFTPISTTSAAGSLFFCTKGTYVNRLTIDTTGSGFVGVIYDTDPIPTSDNRFAVNGNAAIVGALIAGIINLGAGYDFTDFIAGFASGGLLMGWNHTAGGGEMDLFARYNSALAGGYNFYSIDDTGTEKLLFNSNATTGDFSTLGKLAPGIVSAFGTPASIFLTRENATNSIVSRTANQVVGDIGLQLITAITNIVIGPGAGSASITASATQGGSPTGMLVSVTVAGIPGTGTVLSITYATPAGNAPKVILQAANALTAAITGTTQVFPSSGGVGAFDINSGSVALPIGTYSWFVSLV